MSLPSLSFAHSLSLPLSFSLSFSLSLSISFSLSLSFLKLYLTIYSPSLFYSSSLRTYNSRIFGRKLSSLHSHPFFLSFSLSCILSFTNSFPLPFCLSHAHTHTDTYSFFVFRSFPFASRFIHTLTHSLIHSFSLSLSLDPKSVNVTLRGMHEWIGGYGEEAFEKGRRRWIIFNWRRKYKAKSN